jgi:hypothetical protein
MASERRPSKENTLGMVVCPACKASMEPCKVCGDVRRVPVDTAVAWTMERPRSPDPTPGDPVDITTSTRFRADEILFHALDLTVAQIDLVTDPDAACELRSKADQIRATIQSWAKTSSGRAEREALSRKVLGLHTAVRRHIRAAGGGDAVAPSEPPPTPGGIKKPSTG